MFQNNIVNDLFRQQYERGYKVYPISNDVLDTIWLYYHTKELYIDLAKSIIDGYVFFNSFTITWGESVTLKRTPEQIRNTTTILQTALEYKRCFGFCPIRKVYNENTKRTTVTIPNYTDYDYALVDSERGKWIIAYKKGITLPEKMIQSFGYFTTDAILDSIAKDVRVYMWPDSVPIISRNERVTTNLATPIFKLYTKFVRVEEKKENYDIADYNYSRGSPVYKVPEASDPKTVSKVMYTESRAAADGVFTSNAQDNVYITTEKNDSASQKVVSQMQATRQKEIEQEKASSSVQMIDPISKRPVHATRPRIWEYNMHPLEPGMRLTFHPVPKPTEDIFQIEKKYEESICLAFGVPTSYLTDKAVAKSTATHTVAEQSLLQINVETIRTSLQVFYQYLYMFENQDKENAIIEELTKRISPQDDTEQPESDSEGSSKEEKDRDEIERFIMDESVEREIQYRLENLKEAVKTKFSITKRRLISPLSYSSLPNDSEDTQEGEGREIYELMLSELQKIASDTVRVKLKFISDPFNKSVEIDEVVKAVALGAVSRFEATNILRAKYSLPPYDLKQYNDALKDASNEDMLSTVALIMSNGKPMDKSEDEEGNEEAPKKPKKKPAKKKEPSTEASSDEETDTKKKRKKSSNKDSTKKKSESTSDSKKKKKV